MQKTTTKTKKVKENIESVPENVKTEVVIPEYVKQVKVINSKGYVAAIFSHWSHGENFVKDAIEYAEKNEFTFIKE